MTKRVAFFDIAGTLVDTNPWKYLLQHPDISAECRRSVNLRFLPTWVGTKIGLLNDTTFRNRWLHLMAGVFDGWTKSQRDALFDWVVTDKMANTYRSESVARLQQHHADGDHVVLVSGMFSELGAAFAHKLGADAALGSELAEQGNVCMGHLALEPCVGPRKLDYIRQYLAKNDLSTEMSNHFAYADSFSDLPMLEAVGNPVATFPDDALRTVAQTRGWAVLPA